MNRQELVQLIDKGYSSYQIARQFGKAQSTVRYWLCKYDLGTKRVCDCKRCGQTDPEQFTPGRYSRCRKCRGRYQARQFRRYKEKAVAYKGGRCEICGYNKCLAALDFHHRDPNSKDPRWRFMRNWTFDRIKDELDKCSLVCRNCHSEIHYGA